MAITVKHDFSIPAAGQIAFGSGQFQGQQQQFQNQLAMGRLHLQRQQVANQNRQFNDRLRFSAMQTQFQDFANQRNAAQDRAFRAATQARGIQGNLLSQQMATQARMNFANQQSNQQFSQRQELMRQQEEINNANRDREFKERQQMMQYEDEISRQRYEFQLSARQEAEKQQIENQIEMVRSNPNFDEEETQNAIMQLEAKLMGIQPSPQRVENEFPDNKGYGQIWEEMGYAWTRGPDGQPQKEFEIPKDPQPQVDPFDGTTYIQDGGKIVTISSSPFDGAAEAKAFDTFWKDLQQQKVTVHTVDGQSERPLDLEEQQARIDQYLNLREQLRKRYVQNRMEAVGMQRQSENEVQVQQQGGNAAIDRLAEFGAGLVGGIANRQKQIDAAVIEMADQNARIPGDLASQLQLEQPVSAAQYESLEHGQPYFNRTDGKVYRKGLEPNGFQIQGVDSRKSKEQEALDIYNRYLKTSSRYN